MKAPTPKNLTTIPATISVAAGAVAAAVRGWLAAWKPRPDLTLSEWSRVHARLDNGKRYRPFPFQVGIADAFTDPATRFIAVKKSSRIGYSQIVQNFVGYTIAHRPRRLLVYQPTIDDAKKYSRDDIEPVLQWPAVRAVAEFKPRHRDNQITAKRFKGGWLQIKGTNSPKEFRRVTCDVVLLEEPDGYPGSAGVEGDPGRLAYKRNLTSDEPLSAAGSTPILAEQSRIDDLFKQGTQEHRYVPCPHCGTMQILVWGDGTGPGIRWSPTKNPTRAWYECISGSCPPIEETSKAWMDENGEWRAHAPENGPRNRSFHIWSAYSQFEGAAWLILAQEFLAAYKNPTKLKTFVNQSLGEVWQEPGEAPEWERLYERRERAIRIGTAPSWVAMMIGSVDVQRAGRGRLELDIWGFGSRGRRVLVEHVDVEGSVAEAETWEKLDAQIARLWQTEDGRALKLTRVAIDSGDGVNAMAIYHWARRHPGFAMAVKGRHSVGVSQPIAGPTWQDIMVGGRKIKRGVRVWTVGTSMLKLELYGQLSLPRPSEGEPFPDGYVFLPDDVTEEWVRQLVAEQYVTVHQRNGRQRNEWKKIRDRNEALDNAVYARAVAASLGIDLWPEWKWDELLNERSRASRVTRRQRELAAEPATEPDPAPAASPEQPTIINAVQAEPTVARGPTVTIEAPSAGRRSLGSRLAGRRQK